MEKSESNIVLFEEEEVEFIVQTPPRQATPEPHPASETNNLTNEPLAKSVLALFNLPDTFSPIISPCTGVSSSHAKEQINDSAVPTPSAWIATKSTPVAYPQIWKASSRGEMIPNSKKCPLCKRQNDKKECVGGPPCVACQRKGRTASQCSSDEPPTKKKRKLDDDDKDKGEDRDKKRRVGKGRRNFAEKIGMA